MLVSEVVEESFAQTWSGTGEPSVLQYQDTRGSGQTVIGAINIQTIKSFYSICETTNKENVQEFLRKFVVYLDHNKIRPANVVMVLDNHRAHHSNIVRDFCQLKKIYLLFTARYSSPLNAIEHIWAAMKIRWNRFLAGCDGIYDHKHMERDLLRISNEINITPKLA